MRWRAARPPLPRNSARGMPHFVHEGRAGARARFDQAGHLCCNGHFRVSSSPVMPHKVAVACTDAGSGEIDAQADLSEDDPRDICQHPGSDQAGHHRATCEARLSGNQLSHHRAAAEDHDHQHPLSFRKQERLGRRGHPRLCDRCQSPADAHMARWVRFAQGRKAPERGRAQLPAVQGFNRGAHTNRPWSLIGATDASRWTC